MGAVRQFDKNTPPSVKPQSPNNKQRRAGYSSSTRRATRCAALWGEGRKGGALNAARLPWCSSCNTLDQLVAVLHQRNRAASIKRGTQTNRQCETDGPQHVKNARARARTLPTPPKHTHTRHTPSTHGAHDTHHTTHSPSFLKQKRMSSTSRWRCSLRRRPITMPRAVVTF